MYSPLSLVDKLRYLLHQARNVGYHRNSNIIQGINYLISVIAVDDYSEESCNWVAGSIIPFRRTRRDLFYQIESNFPDSISRYVKIIVSDLFDRLLSICVSASIDPTSLEDPNDLSYINSIDDSEYQWNVYPDSSFEDIINEPEAQWLSFMLRHDYGVDISDFDDSDSNDSDDGNDSDNSNDSDNDNDNDDFIDPDYPPEYERFTDSPPLYERIDNDRLLDAGPPLYSEFSLRTMLWSIVRSLA